jgi:hypothetical protein
VSFVDSPFTSSIVADSLHDPRRMSIRHAQAFDLDPDDPRLPALTARMANWSAKNLHSEVDREHENGPSSWSSNS